MDFSLTAAARCIGSSDPVDLEAAKVLAVGLRRVADLATAGFLTPHPCNAQSIALLQGAAQAGKPVKVQSLQTGETYGVLLRTGSLAHGWITQMGASAK